MELSLNSNQISNFIDYIYKKKYSKCLRLGIPSGVADFYQGRSSKSVDDRHYLYKKRIADEKYVLIK